MPVVVETIAAEEEDNIKTLRLCYSPKGPNIEGMEEFIFSVGDATEKSAKKKKKKPKGVKK